MRSLALYLFAFLIATSSLAELSEQYFIVKIYDHTKNMTYEVKALSEIKALDKECKDEARAWPKALTLAQKAWKEIEGNERSTFPRSCAYPKKYTKAGRPFKTTEDAEAKKARYEESMSCGCGKKCGCGGKKDKKKGGGCGGGGGANKNSESAKRKAEKQNVLEAKKQETLDAARALLEEKLAEVIDGATDAE